MKKKRINNINWKRIYVLYIAAIIVFSVLAIVSNRDMLTGPRVAVQFATTTMLMLSLGLYTYVTDREVLERTRNTMAMFTTMIVSYLVIQLYSVWDYAIYLVPFSMCALILSLIVSGKSGFFANFVVITLCFMESINWQTNASLASEHIFYLLFGGIVEAVYVSFVLGKHYRRIRYLSVGLMVGFISAICASISYLMFQEVEALQWNEYFIRIGCAFASGTIGVMLMFMLVPLFEKIFNVVSVFRFAEIASSDNSLMRKLYEKAPGTYNHSLTVATYVEACAMAIGESAIMARAAAYYHDIGKMKNPSYFTENQFSGVNPHDSMTPEASVSMIKSHVTQGLLIAKDYRLPHEVQSAIAEHQGSMPIKYFYLKAQKYTDGKLPYDGYCYDGPKPKGKISAILMICDASEAALRAIGTRENAEKIVNDIIMERLMFDQFSECDITMKEIDIIKSTIITTFSGIKHKRVKYPNVDLVGDK